MTTDITITTPTATWRYQTVRLCADATDYSHESVEEWYDSLGNHADWESEHDGGQVVHPVCSIADLDNKTNKQIADEYGARCAEERAAVARMIGYARSALDAARAVVDELDAAVEAHRAGDLAGVISALREAESAESDYGDTPAVDSLAARLLEEVDEDETPTPEQIRAIRNLARQDRSGEVDDSYARTGDALDTIRRWRAAGAEAGDHELVELIDAVGEDAAAEAYEAAREVEARIAAAGRAHVADVISMGSLTAEQIAADEDPADSWDRLGIIEAAGLARDASAEQIDAARAQLAAEIRRAAREHGEAQ